MRDIIEKGEKAFQDEQFIAKSIVEAILANEIFLLPGLKKEYQVRADRTNKYIEEYLSKSNNAIENPEFNFEYLINEMIDYVECMNAKKKYESAKNNDNRLEYLEKKLFFVEKYDYYDNLIKFMLFFTKSSEIKNIHNFVQIFFGFQGGVLASRTWLLNIHLDVHLDYDEVNILNNRVFLVSSLKMTILHIIYMNYIILLISTVKRNLFDFDIFANLKIHICNALYTSIKYNCYDEILDMISEIIENLKFRFIESKNNISSVSREMILNELSNLVDNCEHLLEKYLEINEKKIIKSR